MWKFISYNDLVYDKVEKKLHDYEKKGYILEKSRFAHFFKFKKRKSDNIGKYIFVYHFPRDFSILETEYVLRKKYKANLIKTDFFGPKIYRIKEEQEEELKIIKSSIIKHHKKCAIKKILATLIFLISFMLIPIISYFQVKFDTSDYIFISLAAVSMIYVFKCLATIFLLKKTEDGSLSHR